MLSPIKRHESYLLIANAAFLPSTETTAILTPFPLTTTFDPEHDKIYFHGAKAGHKVDALKRSDKVCFTVYGNDWYKDDDWAPYVQSTVVFGRCRLVNDDPAFVEDKVRQFALKYYPSAEEVEEEIKQSIRGVQLYEITVEHLCGKQIQEK